jgi:hypothetical protein
MNSQKAKSYYCIIGISLILTACGNKNSDTEPHDDTAYTTYTEDSDKINPNTYEGGHICVSEDGHFTIESGIVPGSGTSPDYWSKWIIIDSLGKKHSILHQMSFYQDKVHAITKSDGTTYYIVNCFEKSGSTDGYEWLQAYKVVGDTIKEVNVTDGCGEINHKDFYINYCIPSWSLITRCDEFDRILDYDAKAKMLYVPIIENREILDRYRVWHFNGEHFVYIGEQPHKGLHKSLHKYNRLICSLTTKDYIVRVDSLNSHELRCAIWKRPKRMGDKPDILLKGGKRKHYVVASGELCPCDDYRFYNGSLEYVVNYCEVRHLDNGLGEHHDFLLVRQKENVLVKQGSEY